MPTSDPSGVVVTYNPTATDAVDGPVGVVCIPPAGGWKFPVGVTEVICVARDKAGNAARTTFRVRVERFGVIQGPQGGSTGPDATACIAAAITDITKLAITVIASGVPGVGQIVWGFKVFSILTEGTKKLQVVIRDLQTGAEVKTLVWDEIKLGNELLGIGFVATCLEYADDAGVISGIEAALNDWYNRLVGGRAATRMANTLSVAFDGRHSGTVKVGLVSNQPGTSTVSVSRTSRAKAATAARRSRLLLRGRTRFARPGRKVVKLRMTQSGKRLFNQRKLRRLKVMVVVSFKPTSGPRRVIARRAATLRR
jgi:hypothetical protein